MVCDWLGSLIGKKLVWFWFYNTQLETALRGFCKVMGRLQTKPSVNLILLTFLRAYLKFFIVLQFSDLFFSFVALRRKPF